MAFFLTRNLFKHIRKIQTRTSLIVKLYTISLLSITIIRARKTIEQSMMKIRTTYNSMINLCFCSYICLRVRVRMRVRVRV